MKTHNAFIYHCLCCGNVVHAEPEQKAPCCCGHEMVKAAEETVGAIEPATPPALGAVTEPAPKAAVRRKPR